MGHGAENSVSPRQHRRVKSEGKGEACSELSEEGSKAATQYESQGMRCMGWGGGEGEGEM